MTDSFKFGCSLAAIAALLVSFLYVVFFDNVGAGEVGVVTTWGAASQETLQPGFHLVMPLAQGINRISTRVQTPDFSEIDASTAELQSIKVTGKVAYVVDPRNAYKLYVQVAGDQQQIEPKLIDPALQTFFKEVSAQYRATCDGVQGDCKSVLQNREQIRTAAKDKLQANLGQYGIDIRDVYIANIAFSASYEKAIEDKQSAIQEAQAAKNRAAAVVASAQGQHDANVLLQQSASDQLIALLYAQAFAKSWDGHLPQVVGSTGSFPFIDLTSKGVPAKK